MERERQYFAADASGHLACLRHGFGKRRLVRNGYWIVYERFDAMRRQVTLQGWTLAAPHDEQVIHVARVVFGRDHDGRPDKRGAVPPGQRPAPCRPPCEKRQARAED